MNNRNRKQKIEYLKGLQAGKRSLSQLIPRPKEKTYVLVQRDHNVYMGDNEKSYTEDEIGNLKAHVLIIENPHLNAADNKNTANLPIDKGEK